MNTNVLQLPKICQRTRVHTHNNTTTDTIYIYKPSLVGFPVVEERLAGSRDN